jgi:hypothetical protein
MRSNRSLVTASFAGAVLALAIATGTAPALSPIERHVVHSYQSAVALYDQARRWSVIARWWINPDAATTPVRRQRPPVKTEDVCQARPATVELR